MAPGCPVGAACPAGGHAPYTPGMPQATYRVAVVLLIAAAAAGFVAMRRLRTGPVPRMPGTWSPV